MRFSLPTEKGGYPALFPRRLLLNGGEALAWSQGIPDRIGEGHSDVETWAFQVASSNIPRLPKHPSTSLEPGTGVLWVPSACGLKSQFSVVSGQQ